MGRLSGAGTNAQQAGKEVVISTLALIEAPSEYTELNAKSITANLWSKRTIWRRSISPTSTKLPFVCGASINNYNRASLDILQRFGMQRFVMPVELSKAKLARDPTKAVIWSGSARPRLFTLAHSARCFTARHKQLTKDHCETVCREYNKGLLAQTQEQQPLLRLNGSKLNPLVV